MAALPPTLAAELAESVYGIMTPGSTGTYRFDRSPALDKRFQFDLSSGPIKAETGGFLGFYQKTTGFALIGHGKDRHKGEHVVAVRGTKLGQDWLTNGNVGLATSHNNSPVHSGFNQTFSSMKPTLEKRLGRQVTGGGTVHCVGHSLGGAMASLIADWVKARFNCTVNLYTFGAPRVGLDGYATKSTFAIDAHYRCTHGADPVPMVPLWPFIHAPNQGGGEYRLDGGQGISVGAHMMGVDAAPGYRNTAQGDDWGALKRRSTNFLNQPVRLKYEQRHQASFTTYWAEKINAALITLLKDAGYYNAVVAQAAIGTTLTFYDMLSRALEKVAKASEQFASQTAGLLGHMLVFAGHAAKAVVDLSYQFIRWVFDKVLSALYRKVRQAIEVI
ncbi:lipase (class 3) [Halospina denitrificans]|uniref:Lipase (Class 3) n=1 Tax=Halospina denitrificans TaxID=332522 RepID=A0A4R7K1X2_9GAMM|nr:lipase family protein [Halospina denitrificans]TDT44364.1 lipase (class 3) [Halospina denitrificans]